jgi:hypothetical protein
MGLYRCAVCGSSRVTPETKQEGYNKKRGTIGMALFGLGGAVAGAGGNTVVYYHCLDCGHTLNKCMSEFEKNNIDRYLLDPDNESNKIMLRMEKKQYPNIEWEESIKAAENSNADSYTKPEGPVYTEEEHKKALEELRGKMAQSHKKEIEPELLPLAKAILNVLYDSGSPCTIGEIQNANETCKEYSYLQLNNIAKCLTEKKLVERFEKDHKAYYKVIPNTHEEAIKILEGNEVNVEVAKVTFSENEIRTFIMDVLCDGKKRTISEMKEDSDKLAHVDSVKLAAATMKMMKQGIIERSEFEKKAYFMLAGGKN